MRSLGLTTRAAVPARIQGIGNMIGQRKVSIRNRTTIRSGMRRGDRDRHASSRARQLASSTGMKRSTSATDSAILLELTPSGRSSRNSGSTASISADIVVVIVTRSATRTMSRNRSTTLAPSSQWLEKPRKPPMMTSRGTSGLNRLSRRTASRPSVP
jgi:hypothetical protein